MRENRRAVCVRGLRLGGRVVNIKRLVCDKDDGDIFFCSGAVLHGYALREPNKASRPIVTCVRDERAFQYVHAVRTVMCVERIDNTGGIPDNPNLHSCVGVFDKILPVQRATDPLVKALLPGKRFCVQCGYFMCPCHFY